MLAGCTVASALQYKFAGPPAVEARYVPAKEPMLVLVENYRSSSGAYSDAEMLARHLMLELKEHDVAPLVPLEKLYALRTGTGEAYRKMSMAAIGRETGAKQVLYVDVQQSAIGAPPGSDLLKGRIAVQVRIVDVATGATRWPAGATEGIPLAYETPLPRADVNTTEPMVRQRMHAAMAVRIARLFYKWKPVDTTEQLDMGEAR
ncbi:MAG TPA: hypothetical protein VGR35_02880 [Tepidisphaeraceae bacterium]|nr:hypothetical protein [Tepidisphaeraceae bacterium]